MPLLGERPEVRKCTNDARAQHEHEREPGTVVHAHRMRLQVVREPGTGKRPRADRRAESAPEQERRAALEPALAVRDEPAQEHDHRDSDAAARVRQQHADDEPVEEKRPRSAKPVWMLAPGRQPEPERQAEVEEQRKRIPVADRRAQPSDPARAEGRHGLAEQRPAERERDHHRQRVRPEPHGPRHVDADREPDDRERDVDEPAVDVLPRAVGLDRPEHRKPTPADERDQQPERDKSLHREHRPRRSHQRSSPERGRDSQRREADPHEPAVRRSRREERRNSREHPCGDQRNQRRMALKGAPHQGREANSGARPCTRLQIDNVREITWGSRSNHASGSN